MFIFRIVYAETHCRPVRRGLEDVHFSLVALRAYDSWKRGNLGISAFFFLV